MVDYTDSTTSYTDTSSTANRHVWRVWNHEYNTTTATTASATNEVVWKIWCRADYATTSATVNYNEQVWVTWIDEYEETKEQKAERERVRAERAEQERLACIARNKRIAETRKREEKAEVTAKELLKDLIGEDQLKIYEETGRLYVRGKKFDYIVPKDGTIQQIRKDTVVDLCVHMKEKSKYPPTDNVIALKLHLETNEDEIVKMANNQGEHRRPPHLPRAACQ